MSKSPIHARMTDIGSLLNDLFQPLGLAGGLLALFLVLYINSVAIPTLPEVFLVIIFTTGYGIDPLLLAVLILIVATLSEALGLMTLYFLAKRIQLPPRIERIFDSYRNFLFVHDERMILVNRVAPLIWFLGMFVAFAHWDLRLSLKYQAIGGLVRYGVILALGGLFLMVTKQGTATLATLVIVLIALAVSFLVALLNRRKLEKRERVSP
jgi:hypothetical protein